MFMPHPARPTETAEALFKKSQDFWRDTNCLTQHWKSGLLAGTVTLATLFVLWGNYSWGTGYQNEYLLSAILLICIALSILSGVASVKWWLVKERPRWGNEYLIRFEKVAPCPMTGKFAFENAVMLADALDWTGKINDPAWVPKYLNLKTIAAKNGQEELR